MSVVLEFAATGDAAAGTRLLLEHRAGLELLGLALTDAGSPYAAAVAAVWPRCRRCTARCATPWPAWRPRGRPARRSASTRSFLRR